MEVHGSLGHSPLFAALNATECDELSALAEARQVAPGERIFRAGDPASHLFVVRSGLVELTMSLRVMGDVKDVRFQTLGPGHAFGWSALVAPHRLTMGARAAEPTGVWCFAADALGRLFEIKPRIGSVVMRNLMQVVSQRLVEAYALWGRELQRHVDDTWRSEP